MELRLDALFLIEIGVYDDARLYLKRKVLLFESTYLRTAKYLKGNTLGSQHISNSRFGR